MILYPQGQLRRGLPSRGRRPPIFSLLGGGAPPGLAGLGVLSGNKGETVSVTRASAKIVFRQDGTTASVTNNQAGVDFRGLCAERVHTNLILRNRDLSNAAWTKSNATAVVGPGSDGVGGAGSVLTAAANDGYAAQAIVASGTRATSVVVRRIAGSGSIAISRDGGVGYTDVTSQVPQGGVWVRPSVSSNVNNPEIRIKLGTAGDSIGVDYVQDEDAAYARSPIATAAASAVCAVDLITLASGVFGLLPTSVGQMDVAFIPQWSTGQNAAGMVIYDTRLDANSGGTELFVQNDTLNFVTRNSVTGMTTTTSSALTWTAGTTYRCRAVWGGGNVLLYRNESLVASGTSANMPNANTAFFVGAAFTGTFEADAFVFNLCFSTP